MAANEGSTKAAGMTAEERLARAWDLFESISEKCSQVNAQMIAIRHALELDPDPDPLALCLTKTGCDMTEDASDRYALEDMLKPEKVAA